MDDKPLFEAGQVIITHKAHFVSLMMQPDYDDCLSLFLNQHLCGDWGDVNELTKRQNDKALQTGQGLLSLYQIQIQYLTGKPAYFKIVTIPDRRLTVIMMDNEHSHIPQFVGSVPAFPSFHEGETLCLQTHLLTKPNLN